MLYHVSSTFNAKLYFFCLNQYSFFILAVVLGNSVPVEGLIVL